MKTPLIKIGLDNYIYDERSWRQFIKKKSIKQLQIKYHKGLGTIKQNEVKKVFGKKMLQFNEDKNSDRFFAIAFDKEESDERKKWSVEMIVSKKVLSLSKNFGIEIDIPENIQEIILKMNKRDDVCDTILQAIAYCKKILLK